MTTRPPRTPPTIAAVWLVDDAADPEDADTAPLVEAVGPVWVAEVDLVAVDVDVDVDVSLDRVSARPKMVARAGSSHVGVLSLI